MGKFTYKKYNKEDQRLLAIWATDCAERVLSFFKKEFPKDDRPQKAIEVSRTWINTGVFRMTDIRGSSLASHAAARKARENSAACFAARAAGQAVATAHVPQHAYGGAYYALKAIVAADPDHAEANVIKERDWQSRHLPKSLRQEIMSRIIVLKNNNRISIKIQKGKGF